MALMSWLMIVCMILQLANKLHSQSEFTQFEFSHFTGEEEDLIYQGDTYFTTDRIIGAPAGQTTIRLTTAVPTDFTNPYPLPNSVGRLLYSAPIRLWDRAARRHATFQTVIRGYIGHPWVGGYTGDGITFFIAPVNTTIPSGPTGGNFGLYNSTGISPVPLFAVELDSFMNTWDPNFRHVGINVNSRNSVAVARWDGGGIVEARITYDARQRLISVVANVSSLGPSIQPLISTLEHAFDLRTLLPEWVQIGISASTGPDYASLHDIRSWSFTSFMVSDDVTNNTDTNEEDEVQDNYIRPVYTGAELRS